MGYSYSVILNKENRKNKTGRYTIFIRVTVDRESKYFPLDERIEEKFWVGKENRWIKESHPFSFELNSIVKKKMDILHKYEYRQKLFGNGISLDGITEHFHKKADPNIFNEFVDEFMKSVKGKSETTLKKYRTFVRYLNEFNPRINFSQLNEPLFQKFASWLEKKGMIGVTVLKYFDPFKVIAWPSLIFRTSTFENRNKGIKLSLYFIEGKKSLNLPSLQNQGHPMPSLQNDIQR